jgi:hypothetical protein
MGGKPLAGEGKPMVGLKISKPLLRTDGGHDALPRLNAWQHTTKAPEAETSGAASTTSDLNGPLGFFSPGGWLRTSIVVLSQAGARSRLVVLSAVLARSRCLVHSRFSGSLKLSGPLRQCGSLRVLVLGALWFPQKHCRS